MRGHLKGLNSAFLRRWGCGFCLLAFANTAFSVELSTLCSSNPCTSQIDIKEQYQNESISNNQNFTSSSSIFIYTQLKDFINHATIKLTHNDSYISIFYDGNSIENFINYGRIETAATHSIGTDSLHYGGYKHIVNYGYISGYIWLSSYEREQSSVTHITNYGTMGGVSHNGDGSNKDIIIDNRGVIHQTRRDGNYHFNTNLKIINYALIIDKDANSFNTFNAQDAEFDPKNNSHIIFVSGKQKGVSFASEKSKLILDFGNEFELGKVYSLDKFFINQSGDSIDVGDVFSHLVTRSDLYDIVKSDGGGDFT